MSQLQSADGMVRCGACLRIFAADDNLLPSVDIRTVSFPTHEEDEDTEEEEIVFNEDQLPLADLTAIEDEDETAEEEGTSIFTLDMADSLPNRVSPIISDSDSSWQFVDDDTPSIQQENSATPLMMAEEDAETSPPVEPAEDSCDEEALETEPENVATQDAEQANEPFTAQGGTPESAEEETLVRARMNALELDPSDFNEYSEPHDLSADDLENVNFDASPLELNWQEKPKSTVGVTLVSLFLVLCLALQTLWLSRHTLAQNAQWRPIIETLCAPLACNLQALSALSLIRSDQLAVQSHPEFSNALRVKMQFRNDASFAQALPGILLKFTTSNDEVLAARRFPPSQYLDDELRNLASMPAKSHLQVSLDVLDPGPQAINYEISFYQASIRD